MKTEVLSSLLQPLPLFVQEKVLKYRKWQDRQRSVIGKNLLMAGLKSIDPAFYSLDHLKYTAYQRPYIDSTLDFNISHAYDFTICAISQTTKVGIDIEKVQPIDLNDFDSQFSRTELKQLSQAKNLQYAFFKLWTQKEAFVKAIGKGLYTSLNKIKIKNGKVRFDDQDWFLHEIDLHPEYHCHLCTSASSPIIIVREIQF